MSQAVAVATEEKKRPPKGKIDMTEGPFLKKIVAFILPLILTGLLQSLYNAADLAVVGQFRGELALAAVGSTGSLTQLILGLFMGLSVGAGVMVAHQMGALRYRAVQKTVHTAIVLATVLGVVVGVIGFFVARPLLVLMDTPETVLDGAALYMRIMFCGTPASMIYNYCAAMLRSTGDTKRPLFFLTVSGLVNVLLNLVFVVGFGMSVEGVGIATIVSQYLSAAMILVYMARTDGVMRVSFRKLRVNRAIVRQMMRIGIPSGLQGAAFSLSNVMIQSSINYFGDVVVAGNSAASNLEGFVYVSMNAVYQASLTFVGQNVGAKKYKNIKKVVLLCLLCTTVIGLLVGGVILLFRDFFVGLYVSDSAAVTQVAITRLFSILPVYFLCGMMEVLSGAIRGMGKSMTAMITSLLGACALRIVWVKLLFVLLAQPKLQHVYLSYPVTWLTVIFLNAWFTILFYRRLEKGKDNLAVSS